MKLWSIASLLLFAHSICADDTRLVIAQRALNTPPSPPYIWYDHCQKNNTGSIPHLLNKLAEKQGYSLHWGKIPPIVESKHQQFNEYRIQQLKDNYADILLSNSQEKGQSTLITTQNALVNTSYLAFLQPRHKISTLEELQPLTGAIAEGPSKPIFKALTKKNLQVRSIPNQAELESLFTNNKIDYLVMGRFQGKLKVREWETKNYNTLEVLKLGVHISALADEKHSLIIQTMDDELAAYHEIGYTDYVSQNFFRLWLSSPEECRSPAS